MDLGEVERGVHELGALETFHLDGRDRLFIDRLLRERDRSEQHTHQHAEQPNTPEASLHRLPPQFSGISAFLDLGSISLDHA
jgi:hypothetical protein